jgi:hypothetical protein
MHIDFGASRGLTVAWSRVTPSVQTLKSWKCHYDGSRYKLRCPEPRGAIQYLNSPLIKNGLTEGKFHTVLLRLLINNLC